MNPRSSQFRGAILHAKHAFMPNSLGYCGPDVRDAILEHLRDSSVTPRLLRGLRSFEAAYPFLGLIARSNGAQPFEYRVPEAYWIGNGLLDRVRGRDFFSFTHEKLPGRDRAEVSALFKRAASARPHHTFHVLSTYATSTVADGPSLTTDGRRKVEGAVDSCMISWGEVTDVRKGGLTVLSRPITLGQDGFRLAEPEPKRVKFDEGIAPFSKVSQGDWVTIHWGFACEVITPRQVRNVERFTMNDISSINGALAGHRRRR